MHAISRRSVLMGADRFGDLVGRIRTGAEIFYLPNQPDFSDMTASDNTRVSDEQFV